MKKNSVMRHYRRWLKKLELRGLNVHEPHVRQVAMLNATLDAFERNMENENDSTKEIDTTEG